ncbi:MAG: hypothetical protein ACRYFS_13545 [Janthinobacterium lividum]
MVVFAATDEPLPNVPSENAFLFQAHSLMAGSEPVLRLFTKPHVYDLTSVGGCGCGFAYGPYDLEVLSETGVPDELKESAKANHQMSIDSVRLLQDFLRGSVGSGTVEVYSCWSGDEKDEPETRIAVSLDHFGGEEFNFVEHQFLVVSEKCDHETPRK